MKFSDPAPFFVRRSLPLLGRTLDDGRVYDVMTAFSAAVRDGPGGIGRWNVAGRGPAGMIAAYAALLDPRVTSVTVVDPPPSHREGPIFLNVLRVLDVPDALGALAPRPLSLFTANAPAFEKVQDFYRIGGGTVKMLALP
jgi:hypothetical protein